MANLITVVRLLLLFIAVAFIYWEPLRLAAVSMAIIAVVFAGDGLDGYVARWRGSASRFGAIFDIAADRAVEQILWVVFADLEVIPIWIPLLVIVRGTLVDALRSLSYAEGMTAFGDRNMMRSAFTRWLTAGRFMRAFFGVVKALGFLFLTGLVAAREPAATGTWVATVYDIALIQVAGWLVVWLSVALTVIRGLPVIVDAIAYVREIEPSPAAPTRTPTRSAEANSIPGGRR
jgi:CDP-diacylglycerol--glycerol-3-phosphate 3-phosphatidyltransferase